MKVLHLNQLARTFLDYDTASAWVGTRRSPEDFEIIEDWEYRERLAQDREARS